MALTETTPLVWLVCHRCGRPFTTPRIRGACSICQDAAAQQWPGLIELPLEVGGE